MWVSRTTEHALQYLHCNRIDRTFSQSMSPSQRCIAAGFIFYMTLRQSFTFRSWGYSLQLSNYICRALADVSQSVARDDGTQSQSYLNAMTQVKDTIKQLRSHPSNQQATIVLMPPASNHVKRTSNAYGSYAVPNNILKTRQGQAEEALSLTHIEAAYPPVMDKMGLHEHRASNDSAQRKAILPICHSTKKACIAATGNCSGHGTCYNKYNRTSSDSEDKGCWACGCSKKGTIRSNRTTHWGGPACSKEDISGPFFLLAGLTIALVAVITWGVGLMYSIGQEDLPSVIGAGVAGPTARK